MTADAAGHPGAAVRAAIVDELPLLSSGKPDYPAVRALAATPTPPIPTPPTCASLFADVLQIDPATVDPDASFVDLGGNSLSYVTMSVRLERTLGRLPADWQRLSLRDLERSTAAQQRSAGARRWRPASRCAQWRSC